MRGQAIAADTPDQMRGFSQPRLTVLDALSDLVLHPVRTFVFSWNWKAALLSAALRAPIFLLATLRRGLEAISVAVLVEAIYSAAISGCYGAFVQKLRNARPLWLSGVVIVLIMPAVLFWCDYRLHRSTGMPNLKGGMLAAGVLALLSSLFNWYLMSHSSLLVGKDGHSLASDLKRMPRLVLDFVAWIPRYGYRLWRSSNLHLQA